MRSRVRAEKLCRRLSRKQRQAIVVDVVECVLQDRLYDSGWDQMPRQAFKAQWASLDPIRELAAGQERGCRMSDEDDCEEVCGEAFDHDLRILHDSDDGRVYECRRCGAEIWEDFEDDA